MGLTKIHRRGYHSELLDLIFSVSRKTEKNKKRQSILAKNRRERARKEGYQVRSRRSFECFQEAGSLRGCERPTVEQENASKPSEI